MERLVGEDGAPRDYTYNDYYSIENCELRLANKKLWTQFHELQTEMIITKSGRRMFPSLNVQFSRLDPDADYCVFLEMHLAQTCRFKFSSSMGWSPIGHEEAQSRHRVYVHPESPSKGSHWMNQEVSFSRVKLTNTCSPPHGQVVLSSMHKYQPRILIVKSSNPGALGWASTKSYFFPETEFIAVTAYQNDKITKLKINYNPFAKGFRENGKSNYSKRKITFDQPDSPNSKKSPTPSPPPLNETKEEASRLCVNSEAPVVPVYRYFYPSYPFCGPQWWNGSIPQLCCQYSYECALSRDREVHKPKKITDFSINAIMNS